MRRAYIVGSGSVGCLHDSARAYTTRRDAESELADIARQMRDMGYRVHGSARNGLVSWNDGFMYAEIIDVDPCDFDGLSREEYVRDFNDYY